MSAWFTTYGFRVVDDGLVTGAVPADAADVERLIADTGVTRVLNLCQDEEYADGARDAVTAAYADRAVVEHRIDVVDFGDVSAPALDDAVATVVPWLEAGETVYVHCRAGWQRSATAAAAVLAVHRGVDVDEALHRIQMRKPSAQPLDHQLRGLRRWWAARTAPASG